MNTSMLIDRALAGTEEDIAYASCATLTSAYREGRLSPVEVAKVLLERIERLNPVANAFVHLDPPATLAAAAQSEQHWRVGSPRSPLEGVPVTIKDLVAVARWPLVRGSMALRGSAPPVEDAPAVARLRDAGAVLLGKTATPEAGCKIVTRSAVHGVTPNPYDLTRTPGGSSGGAASALALGLGPLALGTDGAGSIRIPAAWTSVFGIKPSFGRVPTYPPSVFMPHSVVGPMARDVESARLMLQVISQHEPRDPYALPYSFDHVRAQMHSVRDLRIGVTHHFGVESPPIDPAVLEAVKSAAVHLEREGATIEELEPAWPCDPFEPFMVFWESTYAGFLQNTYSAASIALMDPDLQSIARRGADIDVIRYHKALMQRVSLAAHSRSIFEEYDLILGPVMPFGPPDLEREAPQGFEPGDWRWCPFTYLWNMTGQTAASVPWTAGADGLPIGVQLVGDVGAEPDVIRAAAVLEGGSAAPRRPKLRTTTGMIRPSRPAAISTLAPL
jgi:aspartyl-tRNA(Asn)/glutamyl-tRNA(Gln) amidotransferase subunit A